MNKIKIIFYIILAIGLFSLLFVFLSCGSPKQFSADAPIVISVYPAASVEGVPIDARVSVIFDRDMDPASIDSSSFSLSSPEGAVTGAITYDASSRTAYFTPAALLAASTIYTAALSTAVKSSQGAQMNLPYQWHFTTALTPPTTIPGTPTTTTTTTTTTTIISGWQSVGTTGLAADYSVSLASDNGTPYIASSLSVMKLNGTGWDYVGAPQGLPGYIRDERALSIYNGIPYVAIPEIFTVEVTIKGVTNIQYLQKASVMKFNGSTWESVGAPGFSMGDTRYVSLAVYNGTPYVAYKDLANGKKATVMKFNGASWESMGAPGLSAGEAEDISFVVYLGIPYVAYSDFANSQKATVMKWSGSSWETVGTAGFSAVSAVDISLAVYNDTPFLAFRPGTVDGKAMVMKHNGSSWENVGNPGFSSGMVNSLSLSIYNGTPYVAYSDFANSQKATVMKFNGSNWGSVGTTGLSAGSGSYVSLAIYNGTPYVAYGDGANSYKVTVMKYVGP